MRHCLLLFCLLITHTLHAQHEIQASNIKTLQALTDNYWDGLPLLGLTGEQKLVISFDELSPEYNRFVYQIIHCDANWKESPLSEMEYLNGFNFSPIEDHQRSSLTTVEYTHYWLELPNEQVSLKLSGNYKLILYLDEDRNKPLATVRFFVLEKRITISASVNTNTQIDTNKAHQQLRFTINYQGYDIRNPATELTVKVSQNERTDNSVTTIQPTSITNQQLIYEYNKALIFEAGNEYRRFDMPSIRYPGMRVSSIQYHRPYYHISLVDDFSRNRNYSFDKDKNGRYLITSDGMTGDPSIESDYFFVHFTLPWQEQLEGNLYLQGAFTYNTQNRETEMVYSPQNRAYQATVLLKQGAYDYQYLYFSKGAQRGETALIEGNFFETENEYLILVYHRAWGERYDRLIGLQRIQN